MSDLLAPFVALAERQAKAARRSARRFVIGCILLAASVMLVVCGVGLLVCALFALLAEPLGTAAAAAITGGVVMVIGLLVAVAARSLTR